MTACRHSALLGLLSALGALGSRSNPVAPTQSNPIRANELSRLAFLLILLNGLQWPTNLNKYIFFVINNKY